MPKKIIRERKTLSFHVGMHPFTPALGASLAVQYLKREE